jgi:hypothetical protein
MSPSPDEHFANDEQEAAAEVIRRAERLARDQDCEDLKWLMSNKQGRRFMWRLLAKAHIGKSSFVAPNAMTVSFLEGERNIGSYFQGEVLEMCPTRYFEMVKEHQYAARRNAS